MQDKKEFDIRNFIILLFLSITLFNFTYQIARLIFKNDGFLDFGGNLFYSILLRNDPGALYNWDTINKLYMDIRFPHSPIGAFYPLPFYLILTPFTLINYHTSSLIWHFLNIILFITAVYQMIKLMGWMGSGAKVALALVLAANLYPFIFSLELGQTEGLVLFLLVALFYLVKERKDYAAGITLGLIVCIKVLPAFLIVFFLWKRLWRVFFSAILTIAALHVLSVMAYGLSPHWEWLKVLYREASATHFLWRSNLSLYALFHRMFVNNLFTTPVFNAPVLAKILTWFCLSGIGLMFFWFTRKKTDTISRRFDLEYSLAIVTMILLSSLVEQHHFTWLILPLFVAVEEVLENKKKYLAGILVVSYLLFAMKYYPDGSQLFKYGIFTLFLNLKLYGVIGLWILLLRLIVR